MQQSDVMNQPGDSSAQSNRSGVSRNLQMFLLALIVLAGAAYLIFTAWKARSLALSDAQIAEMQTRAADAIADKYGLRILHLAVIADGGMFELRFQVVDPDKVAVLFDDIQNVPWILDEESRVEMRLDDLPHSHDVPAGLYEYIIFTNHGGEVEPGDRVTISIGDMKLEHYQVLK